MFLSGVVDTKLSGEATTHYLKPYAMVWCGLDQARTGSGGKPNPITLSSAATAAAPLITFTRERCLGERSRPRQAGGEGRSMSMALLIYVEASMR